MDIALLTVSWTLIALAVVGEVWFWLGMML